MDRTFNNDVLDILAARFKVLAEPTRLRILNTLRSGERSVTELVAETGAGQANVSRHLALMHRHGMVGRRKEGLHVYYRIADPVIFELCELMCASLEAELDAARDALTSSGTTPSTSRPR